jgi:hypothetical protein
MDEDKRNKNTTQKTKNMSNTDPTKKLGVNPCVRGGQTVPATNKTPVIVLA